MYFGTNNRYRYMNDLYTAWLNRFESDERTYIANAYIETMREDVEQLKLISNDPRATLSLLHKMKGGCTQIGIEPISKLIESVEDIIKSESKIYTTEIDILIIKINKSIESLSEWCV